MSIPTSKASLYIGLMSGTSADGIDLALVDFSGGKPKLCASYYQAYDDKTATAITSLYSPTNNEIDRALSLDVQLAKRFAQAINDFLTEQQLKPEDIVAIGNHGQTIRHRPEPSAHNSECFTLQIGCSQTLAVLTGIRVIGQFRQKDIALGGQGAPLVPAFHQQLFSNPHQDVFVVNIGGIANISYLPANNPKIMANKPVLGFDTGPGNALLDEWFLQHHPHQNKNYDDNGQWAQSGQVQTALLNHLLADNYFALPAPKSTGREYFNGHWLSQNIASLKAKLGGHYSAEDIQASLLALTVTSISQAITALSPAACVYLCGGGLHNKYMVEQLQQALKPYTVIASDDIDINSDSLEAMAFAWLAYAYDHQLSSNLPAVTGASRATTLGLLFTP